MGRGTSRRNGTSTWRTGCWQIVTEAVHELGHALGLPHCEYPGCVMYFSNWIGDTDRKGPKFCYRCGKRIGRLVVVGRG